MKLPSCSNFPWTGPLQDEPRKFYELTRFSELDYVLVEHFVMDAKAQHKIGVKATPTLGRTYTFDRY